MTDNKWQTQDGVFVIAVQKFEGSDYILTIKAAGEDEWRAKPIGAVMSKLNARIVATWLACNGLQDILLAMGYKAE